MIRIGIITVRENDYHPNRRLLAAAHEAGHSGFLLHPYHQWPVTASGRLSVTADPTIQLPDVVIPRQGAEIGDACLALIHQFQLMGIALVNDQQAVAIARNKFLTQQALTAAGLPCPASVFINDAAGLSHAVEQLGGCPVVVKSVSGRQGSGVVKISDDHELQKRALPMLDRRNGLVIQRYVPTHGRRDIRVLIIGGEVVCTVSLIPAAGDFRANFHRGSQIQTETPDTDTQELAIHAAAVLGCDIAGVDIMIDSKGLPYIVEVNYSPGFKGLEAASGLDIAGRMIRFAIDCYEKITG